jgi:hypothetical protein
MAQAQTVDVRGLLAGLTSREAGVKLAASKALRELSRHQPELVYPHFEVFAELLGHENTILKWNATLTLANLARVDRDGKLDRMLDVYLAPIDGPVMITAANVIKGAAVIAMAKPHLAERIAERMLRVEKARYATAECRNIAIGHALQALGELAGVLGDPGAIRRFASRQRGNPRPATARKAGTLARLHEPR